jgi:hypothetical protein
MKLLSIILLSVLAASGGWVRLIEPMASRVPPEKQVAFLVDLWMHLASYGVGFIGGIVLIVTTWRSRKPTVAGATNAAWIHS